MCKFKSGIILKTRSVVAQGSNDSHTDLLKELQIEDTTQNAMTKFVRAELIPPNNEWWTNPDTWNINIDQDITPDWFNEDKEKYIADFQESVKAWWEAHVLVDKEVEELSSGYYRLKGCEIKRLTKDVQVMCDNSSVQVMCGSSSVQVMHGSSSVQRMYDNSSVQEMYDDSIARDYVNNIIHISSESNLKPVIHKNK